MQIQTHVLGFMFTYIARETFFVKENLLLCARKKKESKKVGESVEKAKGKKPNPIAFHPIPKEKQSSYLLEIQNLYI